MKRILIFITCILAMGILHSRAQVPLQLFVDNIYEARLDLARKLNNKGHHMAAYDSLRILHRDITQVLESQGILTAEIPETKDFIFFQNVLISEAECAYKVSLWNEMKAILVELSKAINERYDKGLGKNKDYYWQIASFYKVSGDYYYIKGKETPLYYDEARSNYKDALDYYDLANETAFQNIDREKSIVYAELAQLEYALCNYDQALEYIEQAVNGTNATRIATGTNAKESYIGAYDKSLNITFQSALAMCQARTFSFRKALHTIDGVMARLTKNDKRLPELKRRRAKILLLQHEEDGTTDIEEASMLYEQYFKAIKDSVNQNFMQMTADQREEYWMQQRPFVVDCYQLEDRNPELLYNVTLYNKGILLQTARSFDDLLYDGSKKGKSNERKQLIEYRQQDAENAIKGITTTQADDYEKQLLKTMSQDGRSKKFFKPLNLTWRDVQKVLPDDGCAIEFLEYEKQDAMHFGALVLRKTGKPEFVHVCNADELAEQNLGDGIFTLKYLLQSTNASLKDDIYKDEIIRDSIWNDDMISTIGNSQKIYFSTDGFLHQLAIEYILPSSLQDKQFYRMSSTRVLAEGRRIDAKKVQNGAAFVLGGIIYDSIFDEDNHQDPGNDALAFKTLQNRGSTFSYMKGAKTECDSIIIYRNNPADLYLDSLKATEHAFYEHCSKYPLIHLSTHGCFTGDTSIYNELLASSSKDVLSESVMALSHAGTHLRNKQFDAFNKDGLLSAREVARLNLENVELVTTSACQTGLGYITADGIYGMQRGFKSAGVKGMIMSLWSVNIESARIFFTSMYKHMAEGEYIYTAFHHARNDLMTKTYTYSITTNRFNAATLSSRETTIIETKPYNTPQHYNPYILIDVWE